MMGWNRKAVKQNSLTTKLYPELNRFETDEDRDVALSRANSTVSGGLRYWLLLAGCMGVMCTATSLVWISKMPTVCKCLIQGAGPVAATFFCAWVFHKKAQGSLRRQLLERGIPICVKCGYYLTGNVSGRCPECGERAGLLDG